MHVGGRLDTHPGKEKKTPELKYASKEFWKELKTPWIDSVSNNKELRWQPERGALGKSEYPTSHFWEVYFISSRTPALLDDVNDSLSQVLLQCACSKVKVLKAKHW